VLPNIEYANFNRLLVTLGFLSIALALAIPWVLLGDTQILLVPESEITDLSTVGEQTIRERQAIYNRLPDFWAAPATLGAVGCILIFSGAIRMYSRQAADDEKADLERDQLALSIGQQSDSERNAAAESEAGAALGDLDPRAELPKASTVAQLAQRIRGLVDSVADQLELAYAAEGAKTLKAVHLAPAGQVIDILVERRAPGAADLIVETGLLLQRRTSDIRSTVSAISEGLARYQSLMPARTAKGLIVLAVADTVPNSKEVQQIRTTAMALLQERGLSNQTDLIVGPEDHIIEEVSLYK
jgi:hypothetical protein